MVENYKYREQDIFSSLFNQHTNMLYDEYDFSFLKKIINIIIIKSSDFQKPKKSVLL